MACLDTTFLVDLIRGEKKVLDALEKLEKSEENISISSISVMELVMGASISNNASIENDKIMKLLESLIILNFDKDCAILAGEIQASLRKSGNLIDLEDIMIGATAVNQNEILITKNKRHFEKIRNLEIETY